MTFDVCCACFAGVPAIDEEQLPALTVRLAPFYF